MSFKISHQIFIIHFFLVLSCKESTSFLTKSSSVKTKMKKVERIKSKLTDYQLICQQAMGVKITKDSKATLYEKIEFNCLIINKNISAANYFLDLDKIKDIQWSVLNNDSMNIPFVQEKIMTNYLSKIGNALKITIKETNSNMFQVSANQNGYSLETSVNIIETENKESNEDTLFNQINTTGTQNENQIDPNAQEMKTNTSTCRPNPFPGQKEICE